MAEVDAKAGADYSQIVSETQKLDAVIQGLAGNLQNMANKTASANQQTMNITRNLKAEAAAQDLVKEATKALTESKDALATAYANGFGNAFKEAAQAHKVAKALVEEAEASVEAAKATETLTTRTVAYNAAGQQVIQTAKVTAGVTQSVTQQVRNLAQAFNEAKEKSQFLAGLKDKSVTNYAQPALNIANDVTLGKSHIFNPDATDAELMHVANAVSKLQKLIANEMARVGMSADEASAKFAKLAQEAKNPSAAFVASEQPFVAAIRAVTAAVEKQGAAEQKTSLKFKDDMAARIKKIQEERMELQRRADYVKKGQTEDPLMWNKVDKNAIRNFLANTKNSAQELRQELSRVGQEGKRAAEGMLLSWQTFERLISIQIVHTTVRALLKALNDGISKATDFQKEIAQIQTLSQNDPRSFQGWSKAIAEIASKNNLDALDAAKAGYEALSNQVARTGNVMQFLTSAAEFAKVTNSGLTDSVNLLTAVMNSYGMSAGQAESVAASLFRTIDLGRVKASEMANTIGRLTISTSAVGVSLYEAEAALAALSIKGTRVSEAYTMLTGVTMKLQKPTKEMKDLFEQWGVASGEAAVKTFGFMGVIMKIQEAVKAGGGGPELTELFNNIRGLRGVQGLSQDDFNEYKYDLNEIQNNSSGPYNKSKQLVMEPPTIKLQKEYQAFQTYFTSELGPAVVGVLQGINEHTWGLTNSVKALVPAFTALAKIGGVIAVGWAAMKAANLVRYYGDLLGKTKQLVDIMATSESSTNRFKSALAGLASGWGAVVVAVGAVAMAYMAYHERQKQLEQDAFDSSVRLQQELTDKYKQQLAERAADTQKYYDYAFRSMNQSFAAVVASENKVSETLKENTLETKRLLDKTLESMSSAYSKILSGLQKTVNEAATEITNIDKRLTEIPRTAEEKNFEHDYAAESDPEKQKFMLNARLASIRQQAAKPATNAVEFENQRRLLAEAETLVQRIAGHNVTALKSAQKKLEADQEILANLQAQFKDQINNVAVTKVIELATQNVAKEQAIVNAKLAEQVSLKEKSAKITADQIAAETAYRSRLVNRQAEAEAKQSQVESAKEQFEVKKKEFEKYKVPNTIPAFKEGAMEDDPERSSKVIDEEYAKAFQLFREMQDMADKVLDPKDAQRAYDIAIKHLQAIKEELTQKQKISQLEELDARRRAAQASVDKLVTETPDMVTHLDKVQSVTKELILAAKNWGNGNELDPALVAVDRTVQMAKASGHASEADVNNVQGNLNSTMSALDKTLNENRSRLNAAVEGREFSKTSADVDNREARVRGYQDTIDALKPIIAQQERAQEVLFQAKQQFEKDVKAQAEQKAAIEAQTRALQALDAEIKASGLKLPQETLNANKMTDAVALFDKSVKLLVEQLRTYGPKKDAQGNIVNPDTGRIQNTSTVGTFEPRNRGSFVSNNQRTSTVSVGGVTISMIVNKAEDMLSPAFVQKFAAALRKGIANGTVNLTPQGIA